MMSRNSKFDNEQRGRRSKGVRKAWKRYLLTLKDGNNDRCFGHECTEGIDVGRGGYYEDECEYVKRKLVLSNLNLDSCDVEYLIKEWEALREAWDFGGETLLQERPFLEKIVVHQCSSYSSYRRQQTAIALVRFFESIGPSLTTVEFQDFNISRFQLDEHCFNILLQGLTKIPNLTTLLIRGFDFRGSDVGAAIQHILSAPNSNLDRLSLYLCYADMNFIQGVSNGLNALSGLKHLDLRDWIYLQDPELEILVNALTQSVSKDTLCDFLLSGSRFLTPNAWVSMGRLLDECSSLQVLWMSTCTYMGTGIRPNDPRYLQFTMALQRNKSLLDLDLGYVILDDYGFEPLWKALEENVTLKRLRIYNPGCCPSLTRSIAHMKGLQVLDLDYPFSSEDEEHLMTEFWKNTSIVEMDVGAPGRCILNRNKCLNEKIPWMLANNKERLNTTTWPLFVELLSNKEVSGERVYSSASAVYAFLVASSPLLVSMHPPPPPSRSGSRKNEVCLTCLDPLVWLKSCIGLQQQQPKFSPC